MRITGVQTEIIKPAGNVAQPKPVEGNFGDAIKKAISEVNDTEQSANVLASKMATGDAVDIHQAMIAMQKASMALQFTLQVRNKVIEAYQEIMRMQV